MLVPAVASRSPVMIRRWRRATTPGPREPTPSRSPSWTVRPAAARREVAIGDDRLLGRLQRFGREHRGRGAGARHCARRNRSSGAIPPAGRRPARPLAAAAPESSASTVSRRVRLKSSTSLPSSTSSTQPGRTTNVARTALRPHCANGRPCPGDGAVARLTSRDERGEFRAWRRAFGRDAWHARHTCATARTRRSSRAVARRGELGSKAAGRAESAHRTRCFQSL